MNRVLSVAFVAQLTLQALTRAGRLAKKLAELAFVKALACARSGSPPAAQGRNAQELMATAYYRGICEEGEMDTRKYLLPFRDVLVDGGVDVRQKR